ncbi:MAG: redoxin domain-containing protein [Acidimicrobiaceae bacterium]|nr:redoxin domain-containing protein [Acidimicrobiaceae bacterium]MYE09729.1 redoxin domain-containing protein [Acidimicrobiaceae bacterium]MYI37284.1 redoxin domain-containing protein [Acidimicrobiaceae bacterium]
MSDRLRQRGSGSGPRWFSRRSARGVGRPDEDVSRRPGEWTSAFSVHGRRHLVFGRSTRDSTQGSGRSVATSNPLLKWLIGGVLAVVAVGVIIEVSRDIYSHVTKPDEVAEVSVAGRALPPFDAELDDPAVGLAAPSFAATTFDGVEVSVQPGDGTAKVIGFYAHWCLECKRELPRVSRWLWLNQLPAGVEVLAVSTDVLSDHSNYPPSAWFAEVGWPAIALRDSEDSEIGDAYGLTTVPYAVVVDGRGRVVARVVGELTDEGWESLVAAAAGVEV